MSTKRRADRVIRATALAYGEGEHDQALLRYLVSLYCCNNPLNRPKITVRKGRGGSTHGIVEDALRVPGNFNRRLIKLDKDRSADEIAIAEKIAEQYNCELHFSVPCIEALLLEILEPNKSYRDKSSSECKSAFANYMPDSKRGNPANYAALFPKSKLTRARKRLAELDELLKFLELT
jgi:hypothetical protein